MLQTFNQMLMPLGLCVVMTLAWWFAPHPLLILPLALLPLLGWMAMRLVIWICLGFIIFSFFFSLFLLRFFFLKQFFSR